MDSNHFGGIDLHIHTTASDGTCTPSEILQRAAAIGLQAVSITDHDTLEGSRNALNCPLPDHLRFIPGVEISTQAPEGFSTGGSLHILGYGVDVHNGLLQEALARLQQAREMRIPKILERLNRIGIPIRMDQILKHIGQGSPGRPHIARVMIDMGTVQDIDEAFDRYLAKGRPAYVDKYRIECRVALELIRQAGGIPVLAHPFLLPGGKTRDLAAMIATLRELGLMGIEAYYSEHPPESVALYLDLARQFDLLVTGGSDFHGDLSPAIKLGRGRGDLHVPFSLYESLVSKIAQQKGD
ncbi:MAG: PHP domain-containing protein [Desulfobacteraceae bacterium]|nr:MAG: PHP domain-containing protein [Desulfobacteraceae bacterium]